MTTARPLRQDAARNRERLVLAAREVFRRKGLHAPLEDIAREAGVAIGTLYNRFPSRSELVDAALGPLAERAVELAEAAAGADDPWAGFAMYVEDTCALFAAERGYADVYRATVPDTPVISAAKDRLTALKLSILDRAKRSGALRADVESTDIAILTWAAVSTMDATRAVAPQMWRRHLALLLDGLRAEAAHPLPAPPLTPAQLREAG
ncbi:TetR/AcrR family transcriptional regulator [Dactylosporangium sp. CA-139066]|uniref:TetR/AcrR family transcriptional regulator n=1 Tax=Dactylosporangium sp. CA-139066 TaxID=3239930 RepID=UPI003D90BD90